MAENIPRSHFNRCPMLWLAVSFAAGILAANTFPIDLRFSAAAAAVTALAALAARRRPSATYLILASFAAAGFSLALIDKQGLSSNRLRVLYDNGTINTGDPVEVEGVLRGAPEPSVDSVFLNLRTEKIMYRGVERTVSGDVRLFLQRDNDPRELPGLNLEIADLRYGSRVRVACKLTREDEFLNPGVIQKREILDRLDIDATGTIKSMLLIEKISDESVFLPLAWVYDRRARLIEELKGNLSGPAAGVMIASLLGDKYFLDKDTAELFRAGGTFHILVISGLHITFIGGLLLLFLRQVTRNRLVQFAVSSIVLWAYTLAVGADVPVVRAAIMFTVISFSYVIYRQGSLLNSLGVCALVLLAWRPSDLTNSSFQLTFLSVAAIVCMALPLVETLRRIGGWTPSVLEPFPPNVPVRLRRFCEMLYWSESAWAVESKRNIWTANLVKEPYLNKRLVSAVQRLAAYLFEGLLVSLIVQIWMLPLLVVYFHRVSVASIFLNLWVGLFISLESFASVIGVAAASVSELLAAPLFSFAEIFNWLMLVVPRLFAAGGWASFRLPAYTGSGRAVYVLYFLPVLFFAVAASRWRPFDLRAPDRLPWARVLSGAFLALVLLTAVIALHPFSAALPDGRLHIDFLDVGQGDAALVTFPDGATLLVDGGGRVGFRKSSEDAEPFEPDIRGISEAVVSEFLWHRGLAHIDHILATHADIDHIQGLTEVAKNFRVGSALFGRAPTGDRDFADLAGVLIRRGIPSELIARGDQLTFGDATVEVLYPDFSDDADAVSDNDHSVVIRIIYGSRTFLLTGDIERPAEADLVAGGGVLSADLIKVAHHGSRTSSTQGMIDAVGARYAVISVGRSSPFGHPHPEVVDRWRASGAAAMTTGERGTISVSTDGNDLEIRTFMH